jgi:hypothetical protein
MAGMRLFHFSDDPDITRFEPRPVRVPAQRAPGQEWLNGPLVWAIDEPHQPMYLFPRDCPRILVWAKPGTTPTDRQRWLGTRSARAYIEAAWLPRLTSAILHRYEFADAGFEDLGDAGMWVCRTAVTPIGQTEVRDLRRALEAQDVELTVLDTLLPLKDIWSTSLHASGIRLRHVQGWSAA